MKNIFKTLEERGICYAVGVSLVEFKAKGSGLCDREYYIIASKKDESNLDDLNFKKSEYQEEEERHFCRQIIERTLSQKEIRFFKDRQELFKKVHHNSYGRVYELKGNSFKSYFDSAN